MKEWRWAEDSWLSVADEHDVYDAQGRAYGLHGVGKTVLGCISRLCIVRLGRLVWSHCMIFP
jgi:hypothetical protein